jgi:alpha,alpha-trehalose phosphorylase
MSDAPARVAVGDFDAVLFDLDGVLTETATVHTACWQQTFDAFLERWNAEHGTNQPPFDPVGDYARYVDGKPRYDGVRDFLASRGISVPEGADDAPPDEESVHGIGNRKDVLVHQTLERDGVAPFAGSVAWIKELQAQRMRMAVVSASKNCALVLAATHLDGCFETRVDGVVAAELGLKGKPAPDTFLEAAQRLGVEPARAVVVEDALAGVAAGRAGGFGLVIGVDRKGNAEELLSHGADVVVRDLGELVTT